MEGLVTIKKVTKVLDVPGADFIKIIQTGGIQAICKKEDFQEGDLCVYVERGTYLPVEPELENLRVNCYVELPDGREAYRIRSMSLQGFFSQGLVITLPVAEAIIKRRNPNVILELLEGLDVTQLIGAYKIETEK